MLPQENNTRYNGRVIANARQAEAYVNSLLNLERGLEPYGKRTYRLDRMWFLLERFGHPERDFQSLHIAGSKGKGSTAVMAASVLEAAGHKVGLFTSPHILSVRERFRVNRKPIALSLYLSLLDSIARSLAPLSPDGFPGGIQQTFFETMTLVGFLAFRELGCRYAVLEVGLGGRLDATNVVTPIASLLTTMEREHEEILGDTIEKITGEKCGIIKPGVPVFSSAQVPAARRVIEAAARRLGAPLEFADRAAAVTVERLSLKKMNIAVSLPPGPPSRFSLSLIGGVQAENAALVFLALHRLFPGLTAGQMKTGLERARLPGHLEIASVRPLLVLDGAHTPRSIERLADTAAALLPAPRVLLFASALGKKHREMAARLAPLFDWIIVSTPGTFKKSNPLAVFAAFRRLHPRSSFEADPRAALRKARALAAGRHPILATGSFYFVAEIKRLLKKPRA